MRKGEELKAPRHASAAATRNGNLPSRDGSLPYLMVTCLIPDNIELRRGQAKRNKSVGFRT
jgi:hypothetical protein